MKFREEDLLNLRKFNIQKTFDEWQRKVQETIFTSKELTMAIDFLIKQLKDQDAQLRELKVEKY